MIYAGIDYSITSPAICVHDGNHWSVDNISFYFFDSVKKRFDIKLHPRYNRSKYPDWTHIHARYDILTNWTFGIVLNADVVGIEGYSMGSKGKVFHLAENMGIMKHKLWKEGIKFVEIPPTNVKMTGTCIGNADKYMMEVEFRNDTGLDIKKDLGIEGKSGPHYDVVDSYWICKHVFLENV